MPARMSNSLSGSRSPISSGLIPTDFSCRYGSIRIENGKLLSLVTAPDFGLGEFWLVGEGARVARRLWCRGISMSSCCSRSQEGASAIKLQRSCGSLWRPHMDGACVAGVSGAKDRFDDHAAQSARGRATSLKRLTRRRYNPPRGPQSSKSDLLSIRSIHVKQ